MIKKRGVFFAVLFAVCFLCIGVSAEGPQSVVEVIDEVTSYVASSPSAGENVALMSIEEQAETEQSPPNVEGSTGGAVTLDVSEPLQVVVVDPNEVAAYSVTGQGYTGDLSTAVKGYFSGVVANNPGTDYVAFRNSQYTYYLFYGRDLQYSDGVFSGSGKYLLYNTQSQTFSRGEDTLLLNDAGYHIYSNLSGNYPVLIDGEGVVYEKAMFYGLLVCLCLAVFYRIFFR